MPSGPRHANDSSEAMEVVELLADGIGSRRPTSRAERRAAEMLRARLGRAGLAAELEDFRGIASFGLPFGAIVGAGVAPALLPHGARRLRSALALLAAGGLIGEGLLETAWVSKALSTSPSQNLVATIEASGTPRRTLCLMAHIDTSRSGLIFHPAVVELVQGWITANSALVALAAIAEPTLGETSVGRRLLALARGLLAGSLVLLAERELRGKDVPGANDNASGCAVVTTLARRIAAEPLASTRVVMLITGCEESGTLGARAFVDAHDTDGWLFLNFDNVGAGGTLRYLLREGVIGHWDADPRMVAAAAGLAARRPDLRMDGERSPAGLTYDATPVLARGGRALTLSIQDGSIPNLHRMTDTVANVDPDGVGRALAAGSELVGAIDRGEAG